MEALGHCLGTVVFAFLFRVLRLPFVSRAFVVRLPVVCRVRSFFRFPVLFSMRMAEFSFSLRKTGRAFENAFFPFLRFNSSEHAERFVNVLKTKQRVIVECHTKINDYVHNTA